MKLTKYFALVAFAFYTASVFADAANLLLSFSTEGPDKYADGKTTVVNGEWYALCWTPNEAFGGITTEFKPAVEGDRIMMAAPLAVDGHCSYAVFQVDSKEKPTGGRYFVYLLDTRDAEGKPAEKATKEGRLVPAFLNGAMASAKFTASGTGPSSQVAKTEVKDAAWGASAIDTTAEGFEQPKIAAFAVDGDKVTITVTGMMPGVKYNIKAGEKVDELNAWALEVPITKSAAENVPFQFDKKDGKFFQVEREPLTK